MNQFPYENLSDEEFENLVIRICKEILGVACKTFSIGKDGAKDSWFSGKASQFPSLSSPWEGTFNIQAKHTKVQNASCSDNDFSVNASSILAKEVKRLNEVQKTSPFNNYLIFTNRKLSGNAHTAIVGMLREGLDIQNVDILGREQIDTYLTDYPHIADQFGLYRFNAPLRFYEKDLKEVIEVFSETLPSISEQVKNYIQSFVAIGKEQKNELNKLSEEYFAFMKRHSLQYFDQIETFLRDPKNEIYMKMYSNTISDLQEVIIIERDRFNEFEHIIKHLVDTVVNSQNGKLVGERGLVRAFIHFMYFNCDIGRTV